MELAKGEYEVTKKVPVYDGFVADTAALVGVTTISTVWPSRGCKVASTAEAPKSWWKSREIEASFKPLTLCTKVSPKAVVSCSAAEISSVTAASASLKLSPARVIA